MLRSVVPSLQRNRSLLGAATWALVALALLAAPAAVAAFERLDAIELEIGEGNLFSAVIDPAGDFAYFGSSATDPGQVVKIDLATFQRVDAITLLSGERSLESAVIDPAGDFAYFGTRTSPGQVVKIDLTTFQRVDAITLPSGEDFLTSAVIDPAGDFAYFGTSVTNPDQVVKIDLATFQRVDAITLESGETFLLSAVIDPAGDFAYFGTIGFPGHVVKIDLATFQRIEAITLSEPTLISAAIDPAGDFAYFGTASQPGRIAKIDLATFQKVGAIELQTDEDAPGSAVIDPAGDFAYFGSGAFDDPGRVVKIDLATFQRDGAIELEDDEADLESAVIDPTGGFAYFGTWTSPGWVVKIGLAEFSSPVDLEVDYKVSVSDGNGVFEPGEQVDVAPAWRNDVGIPLAVTGTASNLSGPAGPMYTLVASDADYGTVPPGDAASCQDTGVCYQMDVGPAGVDRPALHWDASFDETLSDGTASTARTWTLHIGDSFGDVPRTHLFYRFVETLLHHGVAMDCGGGNFCPTLPETREMMAMTVLVAHEGSGFTPPPCVAGSEMFADVPADDPFCPWIEELSQRGVVAGCGSGNYCPADPVTRAQMPVFLLKTLEGEAYTPPSCSGIFDDVACPSLFADWIEELFNRGITAGCGTTPLRYCPSSSINRGQCTVFQSKTFDLPLYGP